MRNRRENFGAQLISFDLCQKTLFKKNTFYLPKITFILQDAPCKMLTFAQLLDKMAALISKDRKSVRNGLRICLSSNKCFVKIPVVPGAEYSKRNYWKLDYSQITGKMVRRHFIGILHFFPELASIVRTEKLNRQPEHQPAACRAVQVRSEMKFSSPFSIESLLKRDSPSAQASTASPPSSVTLRAEQQQLRSAGIKRSFSWDSEEHLLLQPPPSPQQEAAYTMEPLLLELLSPSGGCLSALRPHSPSTPEPELLLISAASTALTSLTLYQHLLMMLSSSNVFYL